MKQRWLRLFLVLFCMPVLAATYKEIGPGGGGRIPVFSISPNNTDLILAATDMGSVLRSTNGGVSWDYLNSTNIKALNYYSTGFNGTLRYLTPVAWSYGGSTVLAGGAAGLYRSTNNGANWSLASGAWTNAGTSTRIGPDFVEFSRLNPARVIAAFNSHINTGERAVYYSTNAGVSWARYTDYTDTNLIVGIMFNERYGYEKSCVVATVSNINFLPASGPWEVRNTGLPLSASKKIQTFAGGGTNGVPGAMYVTMQATVGASTISQVLYKSTDVGLHWTDCTSGLFVSITNGVVPYYQELAVCKTAPNTAYVCYEGGLGWGDPGTHTGGDGGVFKTTNGGATWTETSFINAAHQRYDQNDLTWFAENDWIWAQIEENVFVHATDPNLVLTGRSGLQQSVNGGASWDDMAAQAVTAAGSPGGKLPVLASWNYEVYPGSDLKYHYLSSSDFALFYSEDWGGHWMKVASNTFNNIYRTAVDPVIPVSGLPEVWAAGGNQHGIPKVNNLVDIDTFRGGLMHTTNNWDTVAMIQGDGGLPNLCCTDIFIDTNSPAGNRILWAAVLGGGFYKSTNHGATWSLGSWNYPGGNTNAYKIGRASGNNRLYSLTTYKCDGAYVSGALSLKTGTNAWTTIMYQDTCRYPVDAAFDKNNTNTIYVASMSTSSQNGGIWKTTNGGGAWTKVFTNNCTSVVVDPISSSKLYASVLDEDAGGLYTSINGGTDWTRDANFPAWRPWQITFSPGGKRFINTNGQGVWKEQ